MDKLTYKHDNYNIQEDNYYYPNIMKYPGTNYFIYFISF